VSARIALAGAELLGDPSGALLWPEMATLVVADLHLEKGSSFARRGTMLPPYDTRATLERLAVVLRACDARTVVCLGDSFHDSAGPSRLSPADAALLQSLVAGRRWIWVVGNHDPNLPPTIGGEVAEELRIGPLVFRHEAQAGPVWGEVSGHYHPKASIPTRAGLVGGRCFVADSRRLVLPAFGAYTGGLDAGDPAIARLFPEGCDVHVLGRQRVISLPRRRGKETRD
jgi:DNA ligase-associated metallophosphoesterase